MGASIRALLDAAPGTGSDVTPGGRFRDLVVRCLEMDDDTGRSAPVFFAQLRDTIARHRLGALFVFNGEGEHHRAMVPRGYHRETGAVIEAEMMRWRADYRALAPERQMLAATVVWLYRHGADSTWLRRVPCTWGAAEALHYLRDAGALSHWQRLVTSCPGW